MNLSKISRSILDNGIKPEYPDQLKEHIRASNILNILFILLTIPFIVIYIKYWNIIWVILLLIFLHLLSLLLLHIHKYNIGRFILAVNTSFSVLIMGVLLFSDNSTFGMAPKVRMLGSMVVPFVIFSLKEKKYLIPSVILNILFIFSFDYVNHLISFPGVNLDSAVSRNLALTIAILMLIITFTYYKIRIEKLLKREIEQKEKIITQNQELIAIEEELRQSNEQLFTLKEQLEAQLKKVEETERFLNTIINSVKSAIIVIDGEDKIKFWNKNAEKLLGYSYREIINQYFHSLFVPEEYRKQAFKGLEKFKYTGYINERLKKESLELKALNRDKQLIPVEVRVNSIKINDKWHAVGIVNDIRERKKREEEIKKKNQIIKQTLENLQDSINYATFIQKALLPSREVLDKNLPEYCLIYRPKEGLSGDYYYVQRLDNYLFAAVGDCTGHGIPAALLTIYSITTLNRIIVEKKIFSPAEILEEFRKDFKNTFFQHKSSATEISLIRIDINKKELTYSGAFLPLIIIRDNQLIELPATRNPIGFYPKEIKFTNQSFAIKCKDTLYAFTDGIYDQINTHNRRIGKRNFKEILISINNFSMQEIKNIIEDAISEWQGENEQTDDITLLGIRAKKPEKCKEGKP